MRTKDRVGEGCWDFFFFQAEDGIRDYKVTGVQTCALPISNYGRSAIDVAGPGGTVGPPNSGLAVTLNCSLSGSVTMGNPAACGKGARRWERDRKSVV